jgi:hypothetical protein
MLDLIRSLSFESGAVIVAVISAVLAAAFTRLRSRPLRWLFVLVAPLLLSYELYWLPPRLGANSDSFAEERVWAPLFIVAWSLGGIGASLVVQFAVTRIGRVAEHD